MLLFCLFSVFFFLAAKSTKAPTATTTSLCPQRGGLTTIERLHTFDDFNVERAAYVGESMGYFRFTIENTPYTNVPTNQVWISNTESGWFTPEYTNISYSSPCIINTVRTVLKFTTYDFSRFGFYGIKMRAIYSPVWMLINGTRNGALVFSQQVNTTVGSWTTVSVNRADLDSVSIGCFLPNDASGNCSDVAYDDVDTCFRYAV